jgi:hypothetical protein
VQAKLANPTRRLLKLLIAVALYQVETKFFSAFLRDVTEPSTGQWLFILSC